jgi:hypothetical protein
MDGAGSYFFTAAQVHDVHGRRGGAVAPAPFRSPGPQAEDDGVELFAFRREPVFVAQRAILVGFAYDHTIFFKAFQADGEQMRRHGRLRPDFVEAPCSHEQLSNEEHHPAITDDCR